MSDLLPLPRASHFSLLPWGRDREVVAWWKCRYCPVEIRIVLHDRLRLWRRTVVADPDSWADFHAHLWKHELDAKASP